MTQVRRLIFRRRIDDADLATAEAAFYAALVGRQLAERIEERDQPISGFELVPWLETGKLVIGTDAEGVATQFAPGWCWIAVMHGRRFQQLVQRIQDLDQTPQTTALSWRGRTIQAREIGWLQQLHRGDLYAALEAEGMPTHRWAGER